MIFTDLPAGETVFLDANTLIYHFTGEPIYGAACQQLLRRIDNQEVRGVTSTHILSEMAHRHMTIEATVAFGWPMAGIARRLGRHPGQLQQLTEFRQAVETVLQSQIQVLTIPAPLIVAAAIISQQTGLLSNDALLVAVMQANGLTHLASNDADFDRVPGVTRYAPI
jgi:predicted nucleic acid-binding protein